MQWADGGRNEIATVIRRFPLLVVAAHRHPRLLLLPTYDLLLWLSQFGVDGERSPSQSCCLPTLYVGS